jgi:hypothetical protein
MCLAWLQWCPSRLLCLDLEPPEPNWESSIPTLLPRLSSGLTWDGLGHALAGSLHLVDPLRLAYEGEVVSHEAHEDIGGRLAHHGRLLARQEGDHLDQRPQVLSDRS